MSLPIYADALAQYGAGIALSFADRKLSVNAKNNVKRRLDRKLGQLEALNYLNTQEQSETPEYAKNVELARQYFAEHGRSIKPVNADLAEKVETAVDYYRTNERLNRNTAAKNFALAYGLELIVDAGVFVSQVTTGVGDVVTALMHTAYQGLALGAGIQTGIGVLYFKDIITRSKQEREIDKESKGLTSDGKILNIVSHYVPKVMDITKETEKSSIDYAQLGTKAGEAIANAAEKAGQIVSTGFDALKDGLTAKKRAEEAEKQKTADAEEQAAKDRRNKIAKGLDGY